MARLFRRSKAPARAENIDELTRLNRGFGSFFAEDTGEQPGFILPFNKTQKGELTYRPGYTPGNIAQFEPEETQEEPIYNPELQPEIPPMEGDVLGESSSNPIFDFLDTYNPPAEAIASAPDGGVYLDEQTIVYPTGEVKNSQGQTIKGIASFEEGDLWDDGQLRGRGIEDLIMGIFGSNQAVTQEYGNYNPDIEPGTGYNMGTDIRTRDLQNRVGMVPDDAVVVEVLRDDGTQWGEISGHQGYGNSVLVRLPSGEMMRFSHLSELPNVQVGQVIPGGTPWVKPGSTGNTTGEHLDLEYYNADGQISDPLTFQGWRSKVLGAGKIADATVLSPATQQSIAGYRAQQQNMVPASFDPTMQQPTTQQEQPQPQQQMQHQQAPQASVINPDISPNINPTAPRPKLGTAINRIGDTTTQKLGLKNTPIGTGLGLGEAFGGDPVAQEREISQTAKQFNLPKVGFSEATRGDLPQAGKELSGTITQANLTPRVDLGVSETLRGDLEGAKTVFNDTKTRLLARINEGLDAVTPDAFAAEAQQPTPQSEPQTKTIINQVADNVTGLAGKGLDRLKGVFSNLSNQQRPNMSDLGGNKAIGDTPSGEVLGISSAESQRPTKDTRDPFYKTGQSTKYASFMNPIGTDNRTLTTGTFNNDFFSDPNRVSEVFSGSPQAPKAQSLYIDNFKKQYASKYADPNVYDQADVQRMLSTIGNTDLGYTPNLAAPKLVPPLEPQRQPTVEEYLSKGKTVEQWYAETGRQSELDAIRRSGGDPVAQAKDITNQQAGGVSSGANQNFTPAYANYTDAKTGNASYTPPPARSQAVQNYTPANANYTSGSGRAVYKAPPVQTPKKEENLFSRAYNSITKLFRR